MCIGDIFALLAIKKAAFQQLLGYIFGVLKSLKPALPSQKLFINWLYQQRAQILK